MNKMGVAFGIIIIIIAFILTPFLLDAFDAWNYAEASTTASVTTGGGVTDGNVSLGYELYLANLDSVTAINSTDSDDTPAPANYTEVSRVLNVSGLQASTTRTLTIAYLTARSDSYLPTIGNVAPLLIVVCILAIGAGMVYKSWQ